MFVDLFGPNQLPAGVGSDIASHPHIGLATVTYLFAGAVMHRDSTGAVQRITPGDVNWMHAGRGIVHSERSPDDVRAEDVTVAGAQLWVALPEAHEDDEPRFEHHPAATLPTTTVGDAAVEVLAGSAYGLASPVGVASPLAYCSLTFTGAGQAELPTLTETAAVTIAGEVRVGSTVVPPGHLGDVDEATTIHAAGPATVLVLGGDPLTPRHIWWNYVSSDPERIRAAHQRWQDDAFPGVPGEVGRIDGPSEAPRFTR